VRASGGVPGVPGCLLFNGNIGVLEAVDYGASVALHGIRVHVHDLEQRVESYVSTRRPPVSTAQVVAAVAAAPVIAGAGTREEGRMRRG
jgi:hypothetical protein